MGFSATVSKHFRIMLWRIKIINKKSEHICFYIFGLKCCLQPEMPCLSCPRLHLCKNCSHLTASYCTLYKLRNLNKKFNCMNNIEADLNYPSSFIVKNFTCKYM